MRTVFILPLLFMMLLGSGCTRLHRFDYTRVIMGVEAQVSLYAADEEAARRSAGAAFARMNELDACLSDYRQNSELMQLVRAAADDDAEQVISRDLYVFLERSVAMSARTGGAFDITVSPVVRLWRSARRRGTLPPAEAITEALSRVGYRRISLRGPDQPILLQAGTELDPGGIGKGLALDEALAAATAHGTPRVLINLGGDLVLGAAPPGQTGWAVAIDTDRAGRITQTVSLANIGLATSGDTAQFIEIDGVRYSHIVDPATGLGLTNRLAVTVIAPTATEADGLASAISVLGKESGAALCSEATGTACRIEWIDEHGAQQVLRSPGFAR